MTDAGDGISGDHADWIEPLLSGLIGTQSAGATQPKGAYEVTTPGLKVRLSTNGEVVGLGFGPPYRERVVRATTELAWCHTQGGTFVTKLAGGAIEFARTLTDREQRRFFLHERFTPAIGSVRWEVEVRNTSSDCSVPVITSLRWPDPPHARIWSAWQDPLNLQLNAADGDVARQWNDPLVPQPFRDHTWDYGEPPGGDFSKGDVITLPVVTVLVPGDDLGLSLVQSPEDSLVEMKLMTTEEGRIKLIRSDQRLGTDRAGRWAIDLVPHRGDWRPGLAWMANRYPGFFDPPNPHVQAMACAALTRVTRNRLILNG